MCVFNEKDLPRYTLIMAHLKWLYASDWLSDEDFDKLEKVFAQKYDIDENSIFRLERKK